jgi:hypothetical protein
MIPSAVAAAGGGAGDPGVPISPASVGQLKASSKAAVVRVFRIALSLLMNCLVVNRLSRVGMAVFSYRPKVRLIQEGLASHDFNR